MNNITYENRVVIFLDILGFQKIIQSTVDKDIDRPEKIKLIYDALYKMREYLGVDNDEQTTKRVTQFSDSVIISFHESDEGKVLYVLNDIQLLLIELIGKGILVRGGISYGKMYHDDKFAFGPAFIDAYLTESKAALYPRVILDQKIVDIGKRHHQIYGNPTEEKQNILSLITKDTDGMYYIDYFTKALNQVDDMWTVYVNDLMKIIKDGLKSKGPDLKVKYGWMKSKYNAMASRSNNNVIEEI